MDGSRYGGGKILHAAWSNAVDMYRVYDPEDPVVAITYLKDDIALKRYSKAKGFELVDGDDE